MLNDIEIRILKRMNRIGLWGSHHMQIDNLVNTGYPSHMKGYVKETISLLIRKGYVVYYNRTKNAVQLNLDLQKEIMRLIENGD